jgi:peroxiredoxin
LGNLKKTGYADMQKKHKKMNKSIVVILVIIAVFAAILVGKQYYQSPKFILGEKVPDFSAKIMTGETVHFSDLRGKIVLIQFWGSWCGPCRRENPELKKIFETFQSRGFEIFSIGIERNEAAWKGAIARDEMGWKYQTAEFSEDLKFFKGPIVELFKVHSIPQTYLIDQKGVIIGVDLPPAAIEKVLVAKI